MCCQLHLALETCMFEWLHQLCGLKLQCAAAIPLLPHVPAMLSVLLPFQSCWTVIVSV